MLAIDFSSIKNLFYKNLQNYLILEVFEKKQKATNQISLFSEDVSSFLRPDLL